MPKIYNFRKDCLSEECVLYIQKGVRKGKTRTDVIVDLIEKGMKFYSGHAEPKQEPKQQDKEILEFTAGTGLILDCPLFKPLREETLTGTNYYIRKADSSVCKTCPDYPCEAWRHIRKEDIEKLKCDRALDQIPIMKQWLNQWDNPRFDIRRQQQVLKWYED